MSKIKLNPMIVEISGTMGDLVFRKSKKKGEVIVAMRPRRSNVEPSEAQKAQRECFKQANQYAKAAIADPAMRALYEEIGAKERKSAFAAARSDYLSKNKLTHVEPL